MKKRIAAVIMFVAFGASGANSAFAQGILPSGPTGGAVSSCDDIAQELGSSEEFKKFVQAHEGVLGQRDALNGLLGCAIKTGKIRLFMLPFFVTYIVQFLLTIAGIIAVLFVVYGGYQYVVGGITEDKESGKKTITHALVGLLVAFSAWIIVNFIQVALTT